MVLFGFKSHGINPVEVYCIFMGVNNSNQSSVTLLNSGVYDSEIPPCDVFNLSLSLQIYVNMFFLLSVG